MRLCRNELKRVVGVGAEYRADMDAGATLGLVWHLPIANRRYRRRLAAAASVESDLRISSSLFDLDDPDVAEGPASFERSESEEHSSVRCAVCPQGRRRPKRPCGG
jgi:hypothetical protein